MNDWTGGPCHDCGVDTTPCLQRRGCRHKGKWEYYMLTNALWASIGMTSGYLCIADVERRLGRPLNRHDFSGAPVNDPCPWDTDRLTRAKTRRPGQMEAN